MFSHKYTVWQTVFDKIWILMAKRWQNRFLCRFMGDLEVMYTVHLWLVGMRMVNFLLVLIKLFHQLSRLRHHERILVEIVVFKRRWVTLSANFKWKRGRPITTLGVRKLKSLAITWRPLRDHTFSLFDTIPACDTRTHTYTHTHT